MRRPPPHYVGALVGASPAAAVAGPSAGGTVVVEAASTVTTDDGAVGAPVDPVGLLGARGSGPGVPTLVGWPEVPTLVGGPEVPTLVGGAGVVEVGTVVSAIVVSLTRVVVVVVGKYSGASNPRMIPRPNGGGTTSA